MKFFPTRPVKYWKRLEKIVRRFPPFGLALPIWPVYILTISVAGWSSPVARQAHNLKAAGSNPAPATKNPKQYQILARRPPGRFLLMHNSCQHLVNVLRVPLRETPSGRRGRSTARASGLAKQSYFGPGQ